MIFNNSNYKKNLTRVFLFQSKSCLVTIVILWFFLTLQVNAEETDIYQTQDAQESTIDPIHPNSVPNIPPVSMSMFLVREDQVCRPYRGTEPNRRCQRWTYDEARQLQQSRDVHELSILRNIPPGEVKLGGRLFQAIEQYRTSPRRFPYERKVMFIIFDFGGPQGSPEKPVAVSLERILPTSSSSTPEVSHEVSQLPPFQISGTLDGEQRWLSWESADAFFPLYEVEWVLQLGEHTWRYYTVR